MCLRRGRRVFRRGLGGRFFDGDTIDDCLIDNGVVDNFVFSGTELRRHDHRQIAAHGFAPVPIGGISARHLTVAGAVVRVLGHVRISGVTVDPSLTAFG
jgi:hypothetical protein